ncbi:hypothetical protein [Brucella anthropi]|uniref:hypothetical protein n=1 Tax=Brucella anthropi TaxID=529 RepID=UPI002448F503|nr:hypothetical protein [Brucella anthropi]MDH0368997.1 hypothetical protein [Brucella anthropi]
MPVLSDYMSGTISLANGSVTVTGTGTLFEVTRFREGDTLQIQNLTAVIASVDSDTQLTLTEPWTGASIVNGAYRARQLGDGSRVSTQAATVIQTLGNGVLTNLAELGVEEGKVPVGGPTGEYELVDPSTFGVQDPNGTLEKVAAFPDAQALGGKLLGLKDDAAGRAAARQFIRATSGELRNLIINPLFSINQRAVSGTITLTAGQFGHDRMKAGSSGCTYTFSTNNGVTTLNITSGSIFQIIEASSFAGRAGAYVLSWSGTAQGRILTEAWGTSGNVSRVCDGSSNISVEFTGGTVSLVQFERDYVTDFCTRHVQQEIDFCQRYWQQVAVSFNGMVTSGASYSARERLVPEMRISPVLSATLGGVSGFPSAAPSVLAGNPNTIVIGAVANSTVSGGTFTYTVTCNAEI